MNGKRRNNLDIMADMITVAKNGARKTQLVYKCNLNFSIVKRYISYLLASGLFYFNAPYYYSTEEGNVFLSRYKALNVG